jgi:hypothetical protein
MTYSNLSNDYESTSQAEYGRSDNFEKLKSRRRTNSYSRSGNRPAAFNGVHRRRRKRVTW